MKWAEAHSGRLQGVLFPERLDEAVPVEHPVRFLDELLSQLDWSRFEARYHNRLGQPAIHPQIVVSVILYGTLRGIRSSRALEEALRVRLDFRWLAHGHTLDHSTLSEVRRTFAEERKDLFVQANQLAQGMCGLTLRQLAFDGTRIRANNRRSGSRSVETLEKEFAAEPALVTPAELEREFDELDAGLEQEDSQVEPKLPPELTDAAKRQAALAKAAAELQRIKAGGEKIPPRLPLTDPEARITPNKEGGFAPNYTPLATVDADSGLIVDCDVIPHTDEERHLLDALDRVQETYGVTPEAMLADGAFCTGPVLAGLEARGVDFFSPLTDPQVNPAKRPDLTQPVPAEQWGQLPTHRVKNRDGQMQDQLDKSAFVYDAAHDCYWCPNGQKLPPVNTTSERNVHGERIQRTRYKADADACAGCPLKHRCLQANAQATKRPAREISRDQHEAYRERHRERMATAAAKQAYRRRCSVAERPFAVIKHRFGARQFLLRGRENVRNEWGWLVLAFNLREMIGRLRRPIEPSEAVA